MRENRGQDQSMSNTVNYHQELLHILQSDVQNGKTPSVFLHACCAPCASSCLEVLDRYADITVFFYNPNITIREEYEHRLAEIKRLVREMPFLHKVCVEEGGYDPELFFSMAEGLENEPERGRRCESCYRMRLAQTAGEAGIKGFDYFATTLTLSPLKPAGTINSIGFEIEKELVGKRPDAAEDRGTGGYVQAGSVRYLPSDFKKNNGYLRSIELSKEYGLYRQNYCGCVFSRH